MRIVLDTNVLISALFWAGNERRLLLASLGADHTLVISPAILDEVDRVLHAKFKFPASDAAEFRRTIEQAADVVIPRHRLAVIAADPSDDRILECAVEGEAGIIATGDRHLLGLATFRSIPIRKPVDALREIGE